ncbi:MAG: hypothetical protein EXS67_00790 [Candidatus Margulisbacteria bacterium]|nr:hypothetical protein [Candidatus Margulisiibacteriota bacterium]
MHEKSTDNNEKEQLNILMAKAIATRVEDDPMPIILRKTLIPPIWIPKTATEKEAVTTFMAQQMTALNEATFTAFAQTRILEQPLEAASNKTLYNLQKEISPPHFRFIQHSFITQFND